MSLYRLSGEENLPGIQDEVLYVRLADVASVPRPNEDGNILEDVVLADDVLWSRMYLAQRSGTIQSSVEATAQGELVRTVVNGRVPKAAVVRTATLNRMKSERYLVLVTDQHGQRRLLGTPHNGARLLWDFAQGEGAGGSNAYQVQWAWEAVDEAPWYQAAALSGGGDGDNTLLYIFSWATGVSTPVTQLVYAKGAGILNSQILDNLDSVAYERDTGSGFAPVSLPITLVAGYQLKLTPTITNPAAPASVEITGVY